MACKQEFECGLVSKNDRKPVPLKSVAVSGLIKGYLYGLEAKFTYQNTSSDPLEVVFRFPVDESSAVVGLEAKIDGRTIKGEVKEKEEARQLYDDALSSGLSAALGEEKTGDIFSLTLGNLPPNGDAEITLKLSGEMPLDKEVEAAARFSLPSVLKPRYTPEGSSDPLEPIGGEGSQVESGKAPAVSSFSIMVDNNNEVSSITSPTHGITVTPKDNKYTEVTLSSPGPLIKDLVLLVQYKDPHTPKASVEKGQDVLNNELMSNPAVMLEFFPKFETLQAACEFVFIVDRSGSMYGNYINSAGETLILFLKSIPPGCYFNIIGFGSRYETLFPDSVPYNQTNLDKAMKHAQSLQADLGGTELKRPLQFVYGKKLAVGLPRQVFVLTDGSVSNTNACIDLTKQNAHIARVFTFGIGSGASSALVKGLARAGNGSAEFIKEGERMQGKVISSLKKALQPSVTDLQLKFSVPSGIDVLQAPSKIPPVFNGEKLVLYGWFKGGRGKIGQCTAVLRGKILGSDVEHRIDFNLDEEVCPPSDMAIVHQLAAKSLIQDWESEKAKPEKKAAIIKLSIESSVVSSLTSYIAVDEDQFKPIEGAIKTYDLTAESPSRMKVKSSRGRGMVLIAFGLDMKRKKAAAPRGIMLNHLNCAGFLKKRMSSSPVNHSRKKQAKEVSDVIDEEAMDDYNESSDDEEAMDHYYGSSYDEEAMDDSNESSDDEEENSMVMTSSRSSSSSTDQLSRIVVLQSAEGYWKLDQSLASIIGRSLSDLKSSCPSGCPDDVWGTVLALALLETKYSSQKDEWELLALKSSTWIQGQPLPSGATVASLMQQAKQSLK